MLGKEKIVRGDSYNDYSGDRFRPSIRNKLKPANKSIDIGFYICDGSKIDLYMKYCLDCIQIINNDLNIFLI